MRAVYYAYDDTRFDNKEECLSYEREHNKLIELLNCATPLNSNGKRVIDPAFNLSEIFSIYLPNQDVANAFESLSKDEGYNMPSFLPGYYRYNEKSEMWENIDEVVKEYIKLRSMLIDESEEVFNGQL